MEKSLLVEVDEIRKVFTKNNENFKALDGVRFDLYEGETLGVVGESGSGKTSLARIIMGLELPTSGRVLYKGQDVRKASEKEKKWLNKERQMIYQDTYSSLNPRWQINQVIAEPMDINFNLSKEEREDRVRVLLDDVNLPQDYYYKYPWECSGGERQRVSIARALALEARLIICDEAVSSLDMSMQDQILRLLKDLQDEHKITYIFISHDLAVVQKLCNRVIIMKDGQIVEEGQTDQVYLHPQEDYTKELIASIPRL